MPARVDQLCECGCGETVKPGNRFVKGHHMRTPENRAKISAGRKGMTFSAEHCAAIGAVQKGKPKRPEHKAAMRAAKIGEKHPRWNGGEAAKIARREGLYAEDFTRASVYARDRGTCGICDDKVNPHEWELDHIVPRSKQGSHTLGNVQVTHRTCNRSKRDKLQTEHVIQILDELEGTGFTLDDIIPEALLNADWDRWGYEHDYYPSWPETLENGRVRWTSHPWVNDYDYQQETTI
jgi:hypothetical protein